MQEVSHISARVLRMLAERKVLLQWLTFCWFHHAVAGNTVVWHMLGDPRIAQHVRLRLARLVMTKNHIFEDHGEASER
jgi:hypothetical protein